MPEKKRIFRWGGGKMTGEWKLGPTKKRHDSGGIGLMSLLWEPIHATVDRDRRDRTAPSEGLHVGKETSARKWNNKKQRSAAERNLGESTGAPP